MTTSEQFSKQKMDKVVYRGAPLPRNMHYFDKNCYLHGDWLREDIKKIMVAF